MKLGSQAVDIVSVVVKAATVCDCVIVTDECRFNVELDYNANKLDCHCPQLCVSVSYLRHQPVSFYYLWPPCIAGCGHMYFHPVVSF